MNVNSLFLYGMAGLVVIFVFAQSLHFMKRATRRAKELGISDETVKRTIHSAVAFSIAPAFAILLGVLSLSKFLGLPLPWIRLSILGAITYELSAAASAAASIGASITETVTDPRVYATIAWVMAIGIIPSVLIIPFFLPRIQGGIDALKGKDERWGSLLITALFLGMISAFLGVVFSRIREGLQGWIPVFVLLFSAVVMTTCGYFIKKYRSKWLEDYALPLSILGGMAFAVVITRLIG
ncbi:MAG: DUF5058 family protein [Bacillota bacterium]|nr:DUF5058 family protein [Bacillota bacterium]